MDIRELSPGTIVRWQVDNQVEEGRVLEVRPETVSREIGGRTFTRHGRADDPALLIDQDGSLVVRLASELMSTAGESRG